MGHVAGVARLLLEFAAGSVLSVLILRYWIPLKVIGLFQGDYLASVSLLLGAMLIVMHWNGARSALSSFRRHMLAAAFAGIVLFLVVTAWFDLTFYEAWLTGAKWMRFPFLLIAFFPYLLAEEETLLGPVLHGKKWRRLALALTLRLITWGAMMGGMIVCTTEKSSSACWPFTWGCSILYSGAAWTWCVLKPARRRRRRYSVLYSSRAFAW